MKTSLTWPFLLGSCDSGLACPGLLLEETHYIKRDPISALLSVQSVNEAACTLPGSVSIHLTPWLPVSAVSVSTRKPFMTGSNMNMAVKVYKVLHSPSTVLIISISLKKKKKIDLSEVLFFFTCQGLVLGHSLAACQNHLRSNYPESLCCAGPDQRSAAERERKTNPIISQNLYYVLIAPTKTHVLYYLLISLQPAKCSRS